MTEIKALDHSIWVGEDCLSKIDLSGYSSVAILVDENTKEYCLPLLTEIEPTVIIEIKSGEENKNINTCEYIWKKLTYYKFDRDSLLINLGGGVIGDMGGFAASTYKRGISFIHIPTTLLAMTDASIGGKLGVNFNYLKNQIGLFNNPSSIFINPKFLETLNENELKSGFSEIVKHALIADKDLWSQIQGTPFNKLDLSEIIKISIKIKNDIVLEDSKEEGKRKILNFGHTFGHAIESYYLKKGTSILHGEAIFMGIILETNLSKLSEFDKLNIQSYILNNFKLPYTPPKKELINFLLNDKKNSNRRINFSLLDGIGKCSINNLFNQNEL